MTPLQFIVVGQLLLRAYGTFVINGPALFPKCTICGVTIHERRDRDGLCSRYTPGLRWRDTRGGCVMKLRMFMAKNDLGDFNQAKQHEIAVAIDQWLEAGAP